MKWSKYNYLFKSPLYGYLLYNSLSNSFAELDEEGYIWLQSFMDKNDIEINDIDLYNNLLKMKAIIDDDRDEFYNIKYLTQLQRFSQNYLELTINPTLHCNFACAYCFEANKPPVYMTDFVEDRLVEFVKNMKHIQAIHITWFGGEPLMAFDRVISITNRIKKLGINYTSSMITNGYLLSDKIIDTLENLNISKLQITVDGLADIHNKRRPLVSGAETFDKIIENIDKIKNKNSNYNIGIRVNVDETNASNFINTFRFFYQRYKGNICVSPGFVTNESNCTAADCIFNREKKAKFLMDQYKLYGINLMGLYPAEDRYECPIRNPFHLVIGPEGEIYKCWNDVGNSEKIVGSLMNKEKVNHRLLTRYYTAGDPLDDPNCQNCFHFPICGGGCPYIRIENEFNNEKTDVCDYMKDNISKFLELHYEYKQKISAQNEYSNL